MKLLKRFQIPHHKTVSFFYSTLPQQGGSTQDVSTTKDLHKENQRLADEILYMLDVERHEAELFAQHGKDGHKVAEVLHHVEHHGHRLKNKDQETELHPHIVFGISPEQLKILRGSKRWKTIKALFEISHDIMESEVEQIIRFRFH